MRGESDYEEERLEYNDAQDKKTTLQKSGWRRLPGKKTLPLRQKGEKKKNYFKTNS